MPGGALWYGPTSFVVPKDPREIFPVVEQYCTYLLGCGNPRLPICVPSASIDHAGFPPETRRRSARSTASRRSIGRKSRQNGGRQSIRIILGDGILFWDRGVEAAEAGPRL